MILEAFLSTLFIILITELGDKSMLLSIIFSAKYGRPYLVLAAVLLALSIVTLIGITVGFIIFELVPEYLLGYISGALFIILGIYYLLNSKEKDQDKESGNKTSFFSMFTLMFISEFGDKTQIAVISLTISTLSPIGVFSGAILGFLIINLLAVFIGERISQRISISIIKRVSAVIFIIFGLLAIFGIF